MTVSYPRTERALDRVKDDTPNVPVERSHGIPTIPWGRRGGSAQPLPGVQMAQTHHLAPVHRHVSPVAGTRVPNYAC